MSAARRGLGAADALAAAEPRGRSALRVLDHLWREGPSNREEIIRATGLSRATVSKLVGELRSDGLVIQTPEPQAAPRRSGRPPRRLALNPRVGMVGGIDFGHASVRVAIADLTGRPIAEQRHNLDVDNEAHRAIAQAVAALRRLVARDGAGYGRLLGVGAAISAPVRRDSGELVAAGILPGWTAVQLGRELEHRLRVPAHVGNDANLGALAEARGGAARGVSDAVYVMLSAGVGGGLIVGGELVTGHRGIAGEIGHIVVSPSGAACRCGGRGCLETVAGAGRVLSRLRSALGSDLTLADAAQRARAGEARARRPFADAGRAAGRVAGMICNLVDPEVVIVGGELIVAGETLVDAVREGLAQTALAAARAEIRVAPATLGDRAELLGAIGLALGEAHLGAVAAA